MGDLQSKFSSALDKGEELPLKELGAALGSGHSSNIQLVLCRMPLVARCLVASIFQVQKLTSPRHGVWVPNAPTLCCLLLLLWSPPNASVQKQRLNTAVQVYTQRVEAHALYHACEPSVSPQCYQDQDGEPSNCYPPNASRPSVVTQLWAVC